MVVTMFGKILPFVGKSSYDMTAVIPSNRRAHLDQTLTLHNTKYFVSYTCCTCCSLILPDSLGHHLRLPIANRKQFVLSGPTHHSGVCSTHLSRRTEMTACRSTYSPPSDTATVAPACTSIAIFIRISYDVTVL